MLLFHYGDGGIPILIGVIGLFLVGVFGWLMLGTETTKYIETEKVEYTMAKSEKSIIFDDIKRDNIYYFDKKVDFDNITDTTTIYLSIGKNMYNGETNSVVL